MANGNNITWLIDLPHNTFRPHNNAKCIVIILEKGKPQQERINMAVAEEMGHDHQGKEIYRWNYETGAINKAEVWDDIPLIIDEIRGKRQSKYTFKIDASSITAKNIYVPRYYWQNKTKEIEDLAQKSNLCLFPVSELVKSGILSYFDGHGSPESENKGMGEVPYIRVKDIVNWEIYRDPTARVPLEIFNNMVKPNKILKPLDVVYVRRGSYRIGSVALVSPFDVNVILTREILVLRVNKSSNDYGLDPYYLLYLFSHRLTQLQTYNKVLIETTLPNIGNRWSELLLPFHKDLFQRKAISEKVKSVFEKKWDAIEHINQLRVEFGDINT